MCSYGNKTPFPGDIIGNYPRGERGGGESDGVYTCQCSDAACPVGR